MRNDCCNCLREDQECLPFINQFSYNNNYPPFEPSPPPCPSLTCPTCPSPTCPACPNLTCPTCPSLTCPILPELQTISLLNQTAQTVSNDATNVDLGTVGYSSGNALTFTAPDTINILQPGIYTIYFGSDIILAATGDIVIITPQLNGVLVPGGSASESQAAQDGLVTYNNFIYVYVNPSAQLQFIDGTTGTGDQIATIAVTVVKVNNP